MKILILNWRDIKNPDFGGAEVATYEIAKRWVKWGHEVTWFSSKFKNCKEKEVIDGLKLIRQGSPFTVHLKAFLYYRKHFKNKFDLVIDQVHGIPFFTPFYVKEPKIAYIHELAGKIWFFEWPLPIALIGYFSDLFTFRIFYRKVKFVTGSLATQKDLLSVGISKNRIKVINYGISKNKISSKIKKEKDPTVIFLGRLYRSKRVEDIINAVKLLVKKYPKIHFWIVGKGKNSYTNNLINLVNDLKIDKNVTFYGFVDENQKYELLQKAWTLVMTSLKEGWGLTITEAAVMKTPAVVYNTGGLKDAVINNKTGIICQKNTPYDLAKNIDQLFKNSKFRKSLGENAQVFAKKFSWEKSAEEILKIFSSDSKN
jgi:glycosyltransferase involved in cell wall biosynthesis